MANHSLSTTHTTQATKHLQEIKRLMEPLSAVSDMSMTIDAVRQAHDGLLIYFNNQHPEDEVSAVLSLEESNVLRQQLIKLNSGIHSATETALAVRYLNSPTQADPFECSWINTGFAALLNGQITHWRTLGLLSKSHGPIIVVGSGALPQSQISLYREFDCEIIGLERDAEAASLSREVLNKAGFGHLEVLVEDGANFDYSGAYIVVVATLVEEKHLVARRVAETATDAFLSCRSPVGLHQMWREPVPVQTFSTMGWNLLGRWHPEGSSVASLTFSTNLHD